MALLACNWALLLPIYAADSYADRAPLVAAIGGFLLVYIGGLLMLEAQHKTGDHDRDEILRWQVIGLYLLLIIAAPSVPAIFGKPLPPISLNQFELLIINAMDLVSFGSVAYGARRLFPARAAAAIATLLVIYGVLETVYIVQIFRNPTEGHMPDEWKYAFAAAKLVFTLIFGFTVAYHEMSKADRRKGLIHWTMLLFRMANPTAAPARRKKKNR